MKEKENKICIFLLRKGNWRYPGSWAPLAVSLLPSYSGHYRTLPACPPKCCRGMTEHFHSRVAASQAPLRSYSPLCCPSSQFPISQNVLLFGDFQSFLMNRLCWGTSGLPLSHGLGNSNPPLQLLLDSLAVLTPGMAARSPATSLGAPGKTQCSNPVICSLLLAKSHSLFHVSLPRLWLAEPISSPPDHPVFPRRYSVSSLLLCKSDPSAT